MAEIGINMAELAQRAAVRPNTLTNWKSGKTKRPRKNDIEAVARVIQREPEYLQTGNGPMRPTFEGVMEREYGMVPDTPPTAASHPVLSPAQQIVLDDLLELMGKIPESELPKRWRLAKGAFMTPVIQPAEPVFIVKGEHLRELREARNYTIAELSRRASKHRPRVDAFDHEVSTHYLLGLEQPGTHVISADLAAILDFTLNASVTEIQSRSPETADAPEKRTSDLWPGRSLPG